ncbi:hypothetical protein [Escherichia coli]|uniref:hypothetical protein n=1 Tax=Escherichia coli TaxID=562 RepID=UPI002A35B53F|nr:hypothetical protein [Escherichia coli]
MKPTDLLKTLASWLAGAVVVAIFSWFIWEQGYQRGAGDVRLETTREKLQQTGDALDQFVDGARRLTVQANLASNALAKQISERKEADDISTREIRNALSKTASQRVSCVFDDDIMRQLSEARQRAATAAADGLPGGNDREMPATGSSGR